MLHPRKKAGAILHPYLPITATFLCPQCGYCEVDFIYYVSKVKILRPTSIASFISSVLSLPFQLHL